MNERIIRRVFLVIAAITAAILLFETLYDRFAPAEPADYEVRQAERSLSEGRYEEALARFQAALERRPGDPRAELGRGLVFLQTDRFEEAETVFSALIARLGENLEPEDAEGWGVLAAAYASRGLLRDRQGQYRAALDDYTLALRVNEGRLGGPVLEHTLVHAYQAASLRERADHIAAQLALPEAERLLQPNSRAPESKADGAKP